MTSFPTQVVMKVDVWILDVVVRLRDRQLAIRDSWASRRLSGRDEMRRDELVTSDGLSQESVYGRTNKRVVAVAKEWNAAE